MSHFPHYFIMYHIILCVHVSLTLAKYSIILTLIITPLSLYQHHSLHNVICLQMLVIVSIFYYRLFYLVYVPLTYFCYFLIICMHGVSVVLLQQPNCPRINKCVSYPTIGSLIQMQSCVRSIFL